ncbi:putative transporter [Actinokineospora spheciospongiae]|uniref:Putative transporter n=1 Tax=Actinokineospora spheciospongiae TaxID=909613 RepID=W7IWX8_9PSEU|nr:MFS transporter [Actinokineospora spheciospongiae]EWC60961.1 putative transporter [Actinokineospora spheciospongiae]
MRNTRDLVLIASGAGVSLFGSAVTLLVLLVHFKEFGAFAVTAVLIAEFLPIALGAPLAGLLVDRLPNRRLMIAGQVLQGAAVLGIVATLGNLAATLVLLFALGCGTAVVNPAAAALVPAVVGEDGATRGYSWIATGRALGTLAGSAAGGVLVAALGTERALLVDACTYAVQALGLCLVRAERRPERGGGRVRAADGIRHLRADRVLSTSATCLAIACLGVMFTEVANVFYVTDVLGGDVVLLGVLHACWMVGMLVGVRLVTGLRTATALLVGLGSSCAVMGAAMVLPAAVPFTAAVVVGYALGGITNGAQNVINQALVRLRTPDALRGRAFAAMGSVLMTANVTGMVTGGVLTGLVGPRWTFALAGIPAVLVGLASVAVARGRVASKFNA